MPISFRTETFAFVSNISFECKFGEMCGLDEESTLVALASVEFLARRPSRSRRENSADKIRRYPHVVSRRLYLSSEAAGDNFSSLCMLMRALLKVIAVRGRGRLFLQRSDARGGPSIYTTNHVFRRGIVSGLSPHRSVTY